jgi:predicted metalloenzyme YecM
MTTATVAELAEDPRTLRTEVQAFHARQLARLAELGIDAAGFPVSHVALRVPTWRAYVEARDGLEAVATANLENVWNGRPISKIVLAEPIPVGQQHVDLVELIPPFHQRVYAMGLEHVGLVVPDLESFVERHVGVLTGRQFQAPDFRPAYRLFPDYTHVKFYARSLRRQVELEGATFTGFTHVDWTVADELAGPYEVAG